MLTAPCQSIAVVGSVPVPKPVTINLLPRPPSVMMTAEARWITVGGGGRDDGGRAQYAHVRIHFLLSPWSISENTFVRSFSFIDGHPTLDALYLVVTQRPLA